jgi:hypothetical protein
VYFQLLRRVRRLRTRLLRDLESVRRNLEGRVDLPPSRRLMAEEALRVIADDLAALEQAANVCERRIMKKEKVPDRQHYIFLVPAWTTAPKGWTQNDGEPPHFEQVPPLSTRTEQGEYGRCSRENFCGKAAPETSDAAGAFKGRTRYCR